jgi:hypothetical protein
MSREPDPFGEDEQLADENPRRGGGSNGSLRENLLLLAGIGLVLLATGMALSNTLS